jgi:hypothetical protein
MANRYEVLTHFSSELAKMNIEIDNVRTANEYFYLNIMQKYVERYNGILKKYKEHTGIPIEKFEIYDYELSSTQKTVKDTCVDRLKINIVSSKKAIDEQFDYERSKTVIVNTPSHQMRKCLKVGVEGCPKNPILQANKVFIGMPFDDKYLDSYKYGIELALNACGLEHFRADQTISNIDIMCKICEQMQMCKYLVFNISGLNPNVMLELGLSYGLGKNTIIIKDKDTKNISDIASVEYIEYAHAGELQEKLTKYFNSI